MPTVGAFSIFARRRPRVGMQAESLLDSRRWQTQRRPRVGMQAESLLDSRRWQAQRRHRLTISARKVDPVRVVWVHRGARPIRAFQARMGNWIAREPWASLRSPTIGIGAGVRTTSRLPPTPTCSGPKAENLGGPGAEPPQRFEPRAVCHLARSSGSLISPPKRSRTRHRGEGRAVVDGVRTGAVEQVDFLENVRGGGEIGSVDIG